MRNDSKHVSLTATMLRLVDHADTRCQVLLAVWSGAQGHDYERPKTETGIPSGSVASLDATRGFSSLLVESFIASHPVHSS